MFGHAPVERAGGAASVRGRTFRGAPPDALPARGLDRADPPLPAASPLRSVGGGRGATRTGGTGSACMHGCSGGGLRRRVARRGGESAHLGSPGLLPLVAQSLLLALHAFVLVVRLRLLGVQRPPHLHGTRGASGELREVRFPHADSAPPVWGHTGGVLCCCMQWCRAVSISQGRPRSR